MNADPASVYLSCGRCAREDRSGTAPTHDDAIKRLTAAGWRESPWQSDAWTCPDCAGGDAA